MFPSTKVEVKTAIKDLSRTMGNLVVLQHCNVVSTGCGAEDSPLIGSDVENWRQSLELLSIMFVLVETPKSLTAPSIEEMLSDIIKVTKEKFANAKIFC